MEVPGFKILIPRATGSTDRSGGQRQVEFRTTNGERLRAQGCRPLHSPTDLGRGCRTLQPPNLDLKIVKTKQLENLKGGAL